MNVSNLELILVQKISNSTSTLDTLIYSKALQELKTGTITVVNTTSDLPNPNTAFIGHLFYEKTTEAMYLVDQLGYSRKIEAGPNLYSWGVNACGRLGDGTLTNRDSPVTTVGGGNNWNKVKMSLVGCSAIALKRDGTLWTWGFNACGELGDGTTTNRSSPGTTAGGGTTWCDASMGYFFAAAIKTDGTLWTWGSNSHFQLGLGAGYNSLACRSKPGTISGGGNNWCLISSGSRHSAAIKTDGTLWTWGDNTNGQLGDNSSSTRSSPVTTAAGGFNWCFADAGVTHTAAVKTDGTLWTWGYNGCGRLGDGTTTNRASPGNVSGGGTNWYKASTGFCHTAAIKTDGTLWTWGQNGYGQLGDGTTTARSSPGTVSGGGTNWCFVSAGRDYTIAVKTDGSLWTWGNGGGGRLGNNIQTAQCSPGTTIGNITTWFYASAGNCSSLGLKNFQ